MARISVITAVYNRKDTIGQALDSVLSQSHGDVESVVVDGASTDGTQAIVERYRARLGQFVSERDNGIYDALNKGIQLATGDVIGFMHADDLYASDAVLARVSAAFDDPAVDAVYGDIEYVSHGNIDHVVRYWKSGAFNHARLRMGWMPPHPTFYARRSLYDRLGGFNTRYRIAADYDLMLRFLGAGKARVVYLPEVMVKMRVGGISNRSLKTIARKSMEDFHVVRHNDIGGLGTILYKNVSKLGQFWRR